MAETTPDTAPETGGGPRTEAGRKMVDRLVQAMSDHERSCATCRATLAEERADEIVRIIAIEAEAAREARAATADGMAYFLFQLGYPFDMTVRDSDGDPVTPPVAVLDRLIEEWREHEVLPDTDETRENYRTTFAIEIGRDPWENEQ